VSFPFGHVLTRPDPESGRCLEHCPEFGLGSKSMAPGEVFALHRHDVSDELFIGVEGIVTVIVGDEERELQRGMKIAIARGTVHGLVNRTDEVAEIAFVRIPYLADDLVWV
jgi:quercetin dioxygenase-like cupin family protein